MRKIKNNKRSLELELLDYQNLNIPSPDLEMIYVNNDMYWHPINKTVIIKEHNNIENLLSIVV